MSWLVVWSICFHVWVWLMHMHIRVGMTGIDDDYVFMLIYWIGGLVMSVPWLMCGSVVNGKGVVSGICMCTYALFEGRQWEVYVCYLLPVCLLVGYCDVMYACVWLYEEASGCDMMRHIVTWDLCILRYDEAMGLWNFICVMFACVCMGMAYAYVEIEDCAYCDVICNVVRFPSGCEHDWCMCVPHVMPHVMWWNGLW